MKLIDYAEKKADELMLGHLEDGVILNKEIHVTFAFIVAALSGTFGYTLKLIEPTKAFEQQPWQWLVPAFASVVYLFTLGWHLVARGMVAGDVHHRGNEPRNLLNAELEKYDIDEIRKTECLNLQDRIEKNRLRNRSAGAVLNTVRKGVIGTPFIFLAAWAVVQVVAA